MIDKSYPYARPDLSNNTGIFILAEVALGATRELTDVCYSAEKLKDGKDSTHALGRQMPDPMGDTTVLGDVIAPLGSIINNPKGNRSCNEFIVYNTNQVRMRYIVRITDQ